MKKTKVEKIYVDAVDKHVEFKVIQITKYQHYFDAILNNKVDTVADILQNASLDERQILLHSPFDYEDAEFKDLYSKSARALFPFHLAVSFSSPDVAKLLLKKKVCLAILYLESQKIYKHLVI